MSSEGWLAIFVVVCLLLLWWATSELSGAKVYRYNNIEYLHNLEFNTSLTFLFTIVLTIATSVVVGHVIARFIQPGNFATPSGVTTLVVFVIWLAALVLDGQLLMRAKVVRLTWPDNTAENKIYRVSIASSIAFSTLLTLSLATISATVVAILITQIVQSF